VGEFQITERPPDGWASFCNSSNALFGSADWQHLLEASFGARTLYAWNGSAGTAVTVFGVGPFSVAYLGFPAGSIAVSHDTIAPVISRIRTLKAPRGATCLRIPVSAFGDRYELRYPHVVNPETAIADLQSWDLMGVSKKLRRDLRRAERSGLHVRLVHDQALGPHIYGMYRDSVKRHRGSLRYSPTYFTLLLELAELSPAVRVYVAELASEIVGFATVVRHGDMAYYLHGGAIAEARNLSPSDVILGTAIAAAKTAGCEAFNLMASPADQPNLVQYKEKWGGETRPLETYTVPLSSAYPLFRVAETLYRLVS